MSGLIRHAVASAVDQTVYIIPPATPVLRVIKIKLSKSFPTQKPWWSKYFIFVHIGMSRFELVNINAFCLSNHLAYYIELPELIPIVIVSWLQYDENTVIAGCELSGKY